MKERLRAFFDPPLSLPGAGGGVVRHMFWLGLASRVFFMTVSHRYRVSPYLDYFGFGWEMGRIGRAVATGYGYADPFNGHSGPTAWAPPLYPLLLAGIFKVFGVFTALSAWVAMAINCIFSAAIAPAVYEIGWRCIGRDARGLKVALWSGWLWALYPAAMQYAVHWIWEMSLTTFLFAWVLVLALRMRQSERQTARQWVAFGAIWGLIALSNSSLLAFLPACGLWLIWDSLRTGRLLGAALRNALLGGVCFCAVMSPWVLRNWYTLHAFVPLRANLGAEMFQAVLPENHGLPWGPTLPLAPTHPVFQHYVAVGEVAYSKEQGTRASAMIRANPSSYFWHSLQRIYFFWFNAPHPQGHALEEVLRIANFSFVSVGGLLGLWLAIRRGVFGAWMFFWALLLVPLVYYAVTVQARFRHPLEPILTVLVVYLFQSAERGGAGRFGAENKRRSFGYAQDDRLRRKRRSFGYAQDDN